MDTSNKKIDYLSLLSAVLEGEATKEEEKLIEAWVAKDEKNALYFKQLNDPKYSTTQKKKALLLKDSIFIKTKIKINQKKQQKKLYIWKLIAAASVILLIGISSFNILNNKVVPPLLVEAKSPSGVSSKLTLSDGTLVEINASSSITYPVYFDGESRKVTLNGEAYFEVEEDVNHPFIVETNGIIITVLGTRFNIKSYEDDNKIITSLLEGSVKVAFTHPATSDKKTIVLTPDQQLVFDKNTHQIELREVKANLYASWKYGQCFFENEKFIDICKILERHFGVNITINSPSLNNQLYSGFFTKKEGLDQILNSFSKIRKFEFRQADNGIEIYE